MELESIAGGDVCGARSIDIRGSGAVAGGDLEAWLVFLVRRRLLILFVPEASTLCIREMLASKPLFLITDA